MEFKDYHKKYILNNKVVLKMIPINYVIPDLKNIQSDLIFETPESLYSYIIEEKSFWEQYKEINFFKQYYNAYINAENYLNNFKNESSEYYFQSNITGLKNKLASVPNSKTILVKEFIKHKDKSESFFRGYIYSLDPKSSNSSSSFSSDYLLGVFTGFQYREMIRKIDELIPDQISSFEESKLSMHNLTEEYISKYNELLQDKQNKYTQLDLDYKKQIDEFINDYNVFTKEKEENMSNLEKLYRENLMLKAPAEYWDEISKEYNIKAKKSLIVSICIAVGILILLIGLIFIIPQLNDSDHWFNTIRTTAMLTVITSVLIYGLRVAVKLTMSSFHLARDARERKQLTYFYLSLINEKAVTEKERELIMTSLFSRADTGLLKGDSSPEMPSINITDVFKAS